MVSVDIQRNVVLSGAGSNFLRNMQCSGRHIVLMLLLTSLAAHSRATNRFTFQEAVDDSEQYFTAPLRWDRIDWTYFGVTAAAVAVAHKYDRDVRTHFAVGSRAALGVKDKNSLRDALPSVAIVGATWAYAGLINDSDGYRETWSLLEAGVLSTVSGEMLKLAAGRQRPDVTISPNKWRASGDSFPSVHSSAAFAIGAVFAESGNDEYRWIRRVIGYGVAGATAYIRVRDNVHWLSDTVAGAGLGIATARFVLNRQPHAANRGALQLQPLRDGWMVSYVVDLE